MRKNTNMELQLFEMLCLTLRHYSRTNSCKYTCFLQVKKLQYRIKDKTHLKLTKNASNEMFNILKSVLPPFGQIAIKSFCRNKFQVNGCIFNMFWLCESNRHAIKKRNCWKIPQHMFTYWCLYFSLCYFIWNAIRDPVAEKEFYIIILKTLERVLVQN